MEGNAETALVTLEQTATSGLTLATDATDATDATEAFGGPAAYRRRMRFDDFHAGQRITGGPYRVSEGEVLAFARQYDPQWFHTAAAAAAHGPFEGLIASGWHTCAIAMRLAVDAVLWGSESYASPGISGIRWPHPVRPGDELAFVATVLEVRRSRSGLGVLRWRWQLFNQCGTEVLDLESTSLFRIQAPSAGFPAMA